MITLKRNAFDSVNAFYEGLELTLNASKSGIFAIKSRKGEWLKILTPKQTLQKLPVALTSIKASSVFEKLLNKIRQIIYSLYWPK